MDHYSQNLTNAGMFFVYLKYPAMSIPNHCMAWTENKSSQAMTSVDNHVTAEILNLAHNSVHMNNKWVTWLAMEELDEQVEDYKN